MDNRIKKVVVDTSLALKWVVYETDSPLAQSLLDAWIKQGVTVLAPDLLLYEITNVFYKLFRKNAVSLERVLDAFSALIRMNLDFAATKDEKLSLKALDFARTHKLSATYDAHYLALAEREQCEFWTADERLYNSVKDQLSWVRFMAADASASTPV